MLKTAGFCSPGVLLFRVVPEQGAGAVRTDAFGLFPRPAALMWRTAPALSPTPSLIPVSMRKSNPKR